MVMTIPDAEDNKVLIVVDTDISDMIDDIKALTDKNFKIGSNKNGLEINVKGIMTINPKESKLTFLFEPA